jgi:hypothetical protein
MVYTKFDKNFYETFLWDEPASKQGSLSNQKTKKAPKKTNCASSNISDATSA